MSDGSIYSHIEEELNIFQYDNIKEEIHNEH